MEDYPQDWDPEENEEESQLQDLYKAKNYHKHLQEKTTANILIFFTKFNGLIDKISTNFSNSNKQEIKEIIFPIYEKLFFLQTKFVMLKNNNDFFVNPLNKSLMTEAFQAHKKKTVEFNDESRETTLKLFLRSLLSDSLNEIYLLRLKEFLVVLKETSNLLKKNKSLDEEKIKELSLKKYQKLLKRKEGKQDEPILKEIVEYFKEKKEINFQEKTQFLDRKINVQEKRMRNLKEIFLHYCKKEQNSQKKIKDFMSLGGFLLFLKDFQISNEYTSKPVKKQKKNLFFYNFLKKTLEIFRKNAGNMQETDFETFIMILKKLSEFFFFNDIEKTMEEKFSSLQEFMGLDDRIKVIA